jgi:beta-glucosidase
LNLKKAQGTIIADRRLYAAFVYGAGKEMEPWMKSRNASAMFLGVTAVVLEVSGCLVPPGQGGLPMKDVKPCLTPATSPKVMHTRGDISWPTAECRKKAQALLSKMSLEQKVAQMAQPDRLQLQNEQDIGTFGLGSVLNGGSSDPTSGNDAASWTKWVAIGHMATDESDLKIPLLYGIDAVHGNNNVKDTVVFPHNIGLGATRDPAIVERVGRAAAEEIAAVGIDWTFSPVFAAARDERWGRTYEAFGETPELAAELGAAMVRGLQGDPLGSKYPSVLACAKHFAGDGGTENGVDQGDAKGDMATFKKLHTAQYKAAVDAKVGSVMASYSSLNGVKMHCNGPVLTDVLKNEFGFNGFVVSDWEAVEKLPGTYKDQIAGAINGGVDMVMAPRSYTGMMNAVKSMVPNQISKERIDDAVGRILSIKCELGMFKPDYFPASGVRQDLFDKIGSKEHRQVARQAVAESAVLLKNERNALPLSRQLKRIVVSGKNADDLGNQCGGWTLSWQGSSGAITEGTTVLKAIKKVLSPTGQGAEVVFSEDGSLAKSGDVAVAVIGETPYAEGSGDRKDLGLDADDLKVVRRLKESGATVVVILFSGRPLILDSALQDADAFVAAWLPGTEGDGITDVLFGDKPFVGKLPHSWPRSMAQIPINEGDKNYDPLFPYGFGLTIGNDNGSSTPQAPITPIDSDESTSGADTAVDTAVDTASDSSPGLDT